MSNQFHVDEAKFPTLEDKVVVLTGGAAGIGAATVRLLHSAGANIVFSDLNGTAGNSLLESLGSPSTLTFLPLDASSYTDNIKLFRTALEKYGRIDHAVASAGIIEQGKWFDKDLTVEDLEREEKEGTKGPPTKTIDINLIGTAYFLRVAAVYLGHGLERGKDNKSITLLSSAAGFRESPGLPLYQHGVMGLMRSLRKTLYSRGIRVNNICPHVTDTQMAAHVAVTYRAKGHVVNTAEDVARFILALQVTDGMNGRAIYVEQALGWEFEEGYWDTMPQWLGEEPTKRLREGLNLIGTGDMWNVK